MINLYHPQPLFLGIKWKMAFGKYLPTRQIATIFLAVAAHLLRRLVGIGSLSQGNLPIPSRFFAFFFTQAEPLLKRRVKFLTTIIFYLIRRILILTLLL